MQKKKHKNCLYFGNLFGIVASKVRSTDQNIFKVGHKVSNTVSNDVILMPVLKHRDKVLDLKSKKQSLRVVL